MREPSDEELNEAYEDLKNRAEDGPVIQSGLDDPGEPVQRSGGT